MSNPNPFVSVAFRAWFRPSHARSNGRAPHRKFDRTAETQNIEHATQKSGEMKRSYHEIVQSSPKTQDDILLRIEHFKILNKPTLSEQNTSYNDATLAQQRCSDALASDEAGHDTWWRVDDCVQSAAIAPVPRCPATRHDVRRWTIHWHDLLIEFVENFETKVRQLIWKLTFENTRTQSKIYFGRNLKSNNNLLLR